MTTGRDPSLMSPDDRLAEVASLLAKAYLRLASRRNGLEAGARPVALLGTMNGREPPRKESACRTA